MAAYDFALLMHTSTHLYMYMCRHIYVHTLGESSAVVNAALRLAAQGAMHGYCVRRDARRASCAMRHASQTQATIQQTKAGQLLRLRSCL